MILNVAFVQVGSQYCFLLTELDEHYELKNGLIFFFFFFQAEDGIRDDLVTGVQTCALPICYALSVSFAVGSDPDLNTVNVTNRVNQAMALLPPEVQRIGVTTKKQSSALLQVVAVYSPGGSKDGLFLSNFATINLLDTLRRVPGVGDASLFGALDYAMRVWLNLERMASLDITPNDVVKAVQAQNVQAAVGLVGAAPLMDNVDFQLNITTQGRLTTIEEFENIVVRATPDGALVRIKDIARVELGAKSSDSVGRYNGKPAAGIQIYQLPGANALNTAKGVRKALKELEPRFPDDVAYDVMYDTTVFVQATIESVIHTLIEAFVLVSIVVFVFLGNFRATIIPIIAVPVALIGTFAVMLALGFSLNTISLLALVLAIGIVVDDAIVVVEAVEHIPQHEPDPAPHPPTDNAMRHRPPGAVGLPAGRGPRRLHGRAAASRRRLDQPHAGFDRGSREARGRQAVTAEHLHRQRLQPERRHEPAQPGAGRGWPKTVRRAQGPQALGVPCTRGAERGFRPDRLGQRLRLQPAADHGPGQFVGLRVRRAIAVRR